MTDRTTHISLNVTLTFSLDGYNLHHLTLYETHIYLTCVSISTSVSICYHIWMHNIIYIIHLSLFYVHVLSITYILIQYSI